MGTIEPRRDWSRRLRRLADDAGVLTHSFLGQLSSNSSEMKGRLIAWAIQDYFVSRDFPCLLAILISKIRDPLIRHPLVENMWEEHGSGDVRETHFGLYCRLLSSIGIDCNIADEKATPATLHFVQVQESLAEEDVLMGLGAFCYANEYITVAEFEPLEKAVGMQYPSADLSFFAANREVDARHAQQTEVVIEALLQVSSDIERVEEGALRALRARVSFYDSLMG